MTDNLWKSPIYRFRLPVDNDAIEGSDLVEVIIDVTRSAPAFGGPSKDLQSALDHLFKSGKYGRIDKVVEFGAAKLKNIPFILGYGKDVTAVEFAELMKNETTQATMKECAKYGKKFRTVQFPNPFIDDANKFDLGLLLNVLPTMPVPIERLFVLNLLHEKIKSGKYLLWIAFRETKDYREVRESGSNNCGDGVWMGEGRHVKTFYKYHQLEELDELMGLFGFDRLDILSGEARLYQKNEYNLIGDLVTSQRITSHFPEVIDIEDPTSADPKIVQWTDKTIPIIPNPVELSVESLCIEKLAKIDPGTDNAELYHRLVSHALSRIFRGQLRNLKIKKEIRDGTMIIDSLFTNSADRGFFSTIKASNYDCTHPIVEAKNISDDPKNNEINQLVSRFSPERGNFGILACRKVLDPSAVLERCAAQAHHGAVIVLTDEDIVAMLRYRRDGQFENIDDLMDSKWTDLTYKS